MDHFVVAHSPQLTRRFPEWLKDCYRFNDNSPLCFWQWRNPGTSEIIRPITSSPSVSPFDTFFSLLAEQSTQANRPDTLLFVHGFQTSFSKLRSMLNQLIRCYVHPADSTIGRIVLFYWPSDNTLSYKAYRMERLDAIDSAWVFADLISRWGNYRMDAPGQQHSEKIHLMCHSMGNYLLQQSMEYLTADLSRIRSFFSQIILAAADTDWTLFETGSIFSVLPSLGRRVTLYYHPKDVVLWAAEQQHQVKRLGRDGPSNMAEILSGLPYRDSLHLIRCCQDSPKPITNTREKLLHHWYYYARHEVVQDIRAVLFNQTPSGRINLSPASVSFALTN